MGSDCISSWSLLIFLLFKVVCFNSISEAMFLVILLSNGAWLAFKKWLLYITQSPEWNPGFKGTREKRMLNFSPLLQRKQSVDFIFPVFVTKFIIGMLKTFVYWVIDKTLKKFHVSLGTNWLNLHMTFLCFLLSIKSNKCCNLKQV